MELNEKFFCVSLITLLLVSMTMVTMVPMVKVASASPDTYFFVDPPEVKNDDPFLININVTDAPNSYAWEIYISWDPNLLELVYYDEGDFLHRWKPNPFPPPDYIPKYETNFVFAPSLAEANVEGEIKFGCGLIGDVPWANGTGWLMSLGFFVDAEGSCVLDLFNTRLYDYELPGGPAFTYYPNEDGFFYNRDYPPNSLFHDIAVDNVAPAVLEAYVGESVAINVTVTNEGNYTETSGTFNVTVYADITVYEYEYDILGRLIKTTVVVGDEITVGTQTITGSLAPGATTTLTFTWNTTGIAGGNYTISAEVKGDDDTRDNLLIDSIVQARRIAGDVNGDGTVDGSDLTRMSEAYGSELGDSNWDEECDFNGDSKVDVSDMFDLGENYGRSV